MHYYPVNRQVCALEMGYTVSPLPIVCVVLPTNRVTWPYDSRRSLSTQSLDRLETQRSDRLSTVKRGNPMWKTSLCNQFRRGVHK